MLTRRTFLATTLAAPAVLRAQSALPKLTHFRFTRWRADPFAYGAYSNLARGARTEQRDDLAAPLGPLFFAGEATNGDHPSTVHGALLSGRRAAREIAASGKRRVAVIGAGFAGLGAAKDLAQAGLDVTVIEARNRLGGRVFTDNLGDGKIDQGASWIHGTEDNPLSDLVRATGTETRVTDWGNFAFFRTDGRRRLNPIPPLSMLDIEVSQSFGADRDALSPDAFDEGLEFGGDEVTFTEGYASLIPALLGGYEIETGKPVSRIDWTPTGGATLTLRGSRRSFDAVLVTVPLGVLKFGDLTFAPALPEAKQSAIRDLGMGHLSKVFLRFEAPFWDTDLDAFGYINTDPSSFATWVNIGRTNDTPTLMAFHGGRAADALEEKSDDQVETLAMDVLRTIWG
ncbi:MAG: FAD-dependent oxidoreductase [Pseudomonadota bacterium]